MQVTLSKRLRIRVLRRLRVRLLFAVAGALCTGLWGCSQSVPSKDAGGEKNPDYQKARALYGAGDYQGAAGRFEQVLLVDPRSASAHLELGLLYDEKLGDPIEAIHHYRQYLALQPESDKRQLVKDFIERAQLTLAAKLPQGSGADFNEVARLRSENAQLLQENIALKSKVADIEAAAAGRPRPVQEPGVTPPPAVVATQVAIAAPDSSSKPKTHVVQRGDTLQSLALKYYGTRSAWDKIYQANRDILPSKDQLKVGQQLNLP